MPDQTSIQQSLWNRLPPAEQEKAAAEFWAALPEAKRTSVILGAIRDEVREMVRDVYVADARRMAVEMLDRAVASAMAKAVTSGCRGFSRSVPGLEVIVREAFVGQAAALAHDAAKKAAARMRVSLTVCEG